jgi:N-acetylmuramoyl-L-alanine amidase
MGGDLGLAPAMDASARVPAPRDPLRWATDVPAAVLARSASIVVARGADTVRLPLATVELDTATAPRLIMLGAAAAAAGDTDKVVVGRSVPDPSGISRWFLVPGTIVQQTGHIGNYTRIKLDTMLDIWVEDPDVTPLRSGVAAPRPAITSARLAPAADWVDLVLPLGEPVPFLVEEEQRALTLTLYGARVSIDAIAFPANDSLVRTVNAMQVATDRAQITLALDAAPYGYQTLWDNGRFILRVRRPPNIDRSHPLRGLTIAVDPGHPPIGATGPTGLYEGDAVLAVGQRVKRMLEERGATVFMTRSDASPVALGDRPIMARHANAHAFVSIHLNAYPDGVNPFVANGTGTYFFFPHSERLARAVQSRLVPELGLRNVGVFQQSFAVIRNTWMPAVLAEGAFVIIPEQEAALRTAEYQESYARGLVHGLEAYFRALHGTR